MKFEGKVKEEIYWRGFEDGKRSSLNHNIILMKLQLKSSKDIYKNKKCKYCGNQVSSFYKNAKVCDNCKSELAKKANIKRQKIREKDASKVEGEQWK